MEIQNLRVASGILNRGSAYAKATDVTGDADNTDGKEEGCKRGDFSFFIRVIRAIRG